MDTLSDKLGKRALAAPFVIALLLLCILGLALSPMMRMEAKNLPIAVVNEDAGAVLPTGEMNAGELMVQNFRAMTAGAEDAAMKITVVESRDAVIQAMEAGEYYAALVIPENFTMLQVAAQMGTGTESPVIELIVNTVKSPLVAQTIQQQLTMTMAKAGLDVQVTGIGAAAQSSNMMAGMMGVQMLVMPIVMLSLIMSLFAVIVLWTLKKPATVAEKGKQLGMQIAYAVVAAAVAAVCAYGIVAWFGGVEIPASAILYLWAVSFCIMLANIGLCDLCLPLGALVMVCVFAFGMATAVLPAEMLPDFWVNWVLPWVPQPAIGDGVRNIIYLGGNGFEAGFGRLLVWACVGVVAAAIAVVLPARKAKVAEGEAEAA